MKTLNLMLHAGAYRVEPKALAEVRTPGETKTWCPIPHASFVGGIRESLLRSGLQVVQEAHALAHDGDRYFGMMQVVGGSQKSDYDLVVGLRNSHDQQFPAGLVVGSGVFVCDNLAFSGEIRIARKHTRWTNRDLPGLIEGAVGRIGDMRRHQDARILSYKGTTLSDAQVHDLLIQSVDARVCPITRVPAVLADWRKPRHDEFAPRTAWSLFNCYTEALKESALFDRPRATQALHGLLDTACHLN